MLMFTLGRVLFGAYFMYSGINHFKDEKMLIGYAKSKGVPSSRVAVLLTGAMLVVGGLGIMTNINVGESSMLLLLFLIPTTFMMHNFWKTHDPAHKASDKGAFIRNLAFIGALLMMI